MREYLHINLQKQSVQREELHGEAIARAGRYLIAKSLLDSGAAVVDPLSADNPLIFSAGPFAGTNFSNANRLSVGCKSPLTGGIKEANAGGTFGFALGQLGLAGLTLNGASTDWTVIHIAKDGQISFDTAEPYLGLGNFEAAALLHEKYGKKVSLALCSAVGEYQGLIAGISFSDTDQRPSRLAARGGVGAVMGGKKVKAIVAELNRMPQLHDRKKVISAVKTYNAKLNEDEIAQNQKTYGTALMGDVQNYLGGLPVRNFSDGRITTSDDETMKMGGQHIREMQLERGGQTAHACMPGCTIECSNVYVDKDGTEITSPVEYETLGLMGTNCGLTEPDELAEVNSVANDLGIDTIETGAMIAVLMEAGLGAFGDVSFMQEVLEEIRSGSEKGRLWAQGTARVGEHYKVTRVPVIKQQAISAYDPRVVEATGITMMVSAQGADHTAGNVPKLDCTNMSVDEVVAASVEAQQVMASSDALGLCIFGRGVTDTNVAFVINAINDAHGTDLSEEFYKELGVETLALEHQFNLDAGFTVADDELPEFFYSEPLAPTGKVARFHGPEVNKALGH
ncbi:MAG: aldehyde ferredoxin oxidoreductase [Pseudomonadota bacterium]|jgi:aldehyde:ferredoxin oxidoreductase|nr:MAG: aldehyde ferredoxin oxidoreductase [Pseudomonadota bacterium]|tara:strand:+ start:644 stop:2344 length:1701 start_codon:yes stop_codon:yes gene_type:complete